MFATPCLFGAAIGTPFIAIPARVSPIAGNATEVRNFVADPHLPDAFAFEVTPDHAAQHVPEIPIWDL